MLRTIAFICAALMLLALLPLPIGFYMFLRFSVTIGAFLLAREQWKQSGINVWVLLFGALAILFNPIMPIYLGDRSLWLPWNLVGAALFLIAAIRMAPTQTPSGRA